MRERRDGGRWVGLFMALGLLFANHTYGDAPSSAWGTSATTSAEAPDGLGPVKFEMSAAQVKELCKGEWKPLPVESWALLPSSSGTFHCTRLPMKLGFGGYTLFLGFCPKDKLCVIELRKGLTSWSDPVIAHVRGALSTKYGRTTPQRDIKSRAWHVWEFPKRNKAGLASRIALEVSPERQLHLYYFSERAAFASTSRAKSGLQPLNQLREPIESKETQAY